MSRMRVVFVQKILPIGAVAFLLLSAPLTLAAQEQAATAVGQASAFDFWRELTGWFAGVVGTSLESGGEATTQGSCALDPYGCPDPG